MAIKETKTVSVMALDSTNTVITGIWDSDNLDEYNCLAIPDATMFVPGSRGGFEYQKVTQIGENAFQGNIWIQSVYIPVNITHIQKNAFYGCNSISKVMYAGTETQWQSIVMESGNDILKTVSIEYGAVMPITND